MKVCIVENFLLFELEHPVYNSIDYAKEVVWALLLNDYDNILKSHNITDLEELISGGHIIFREVDIQYRPVDYNANFISCSPEEPCNYCDGSDCYKCGSHTLKKCVCDWFDRHNL